MLRSPGPGPGRMEAGAARAGGPGEGARSPGAGPGPLGQVAWPAAGCRAVLTLALGSAPAGPLGQAAGAPFGHGRAAPARAVRDQRPSRLRAGSAPAAGARTRARCPARAGAEVTASGPAVWRADWRAAPWPHARGWSVWVTAAPWGRSGSAIRAGVPGGPPVVTWLPARAAPFLPGRRPDDLTAEDKLAAAAATIKSMRAARSVNGWSNWKPITVPGPGCGDRGGWPQGGCSRPLRASSASRSAERELIPSLGKVRYK